MTWAKRTVNLVGIRVPVDGNELRLGINTQLVHVVILEENARNSRNLYRSWKRNAATLVHPLLDCVVLDTQLRRKVQIHRVHLVAEILLRLLRDVAVLDLREVNALLRFLNELLRSTPERTITALSSIGSVTLAVAFKQLSIMENMKSSNWLMIS